MLEDSYDDDGQNDDGANYGGDSDDNRHDDERDNQHGSLMVCVFVADRPHSFNFCIVYKLFIPGACLQIDPYGF